MKYYTHVAVSGSNLLVRGVDGGRRFNDRVNFRPRLFVPSKNPGTARYHSLFGAALEDLEFGDISDAREFIKTYAGVSNMTIHGNTNWQYQYITETYPGVIDFNINDIAIYSIDIETTTELGFPNVDDPQEQVQLITIQDLNQRRITTYGQRPWAGKRDDVNYVHCADEASLLRRFLADWAQVQPDVITGWNITLFDVPYLVNRIERVLGESSARQLSPWRQIKRREIQFAEKVLTAFEIVGITQLDYLDLYKKFTYSAQESYKLDYICRQELGVGKLENPHDTFKEFYTQSWDMFVDYNIVDTERVLQLEDKMKLIELALTMAYDAKCNFSDVFSAVRTWDCVLYNHLWNKNIVVHPRNTDRPDRSIEGAYVQEPRPGQYDWVVSFDATSLYPSIIMQYNMSPETLVPLATDPHVSISVDQLLEQKVDAAALQEAQDHNNCLSANGFYFRQDQRGLFPEIVEKLFADRQMYKRRMLEAQRLYEDTKQNKYLNDISRYQNFQMARKIQLNSLFGAWANYFFRYFDDRIAEGITITGQYIIRTVGQELNRYLNEICETKDYEYSFYSDTESCYITLDPLVRKFYANKSREEIVKILDRICEDKITPVINAACDRLADYTNASNRKIVFKREAIADRGIWVAKKRYALNVYNNEGVTYAEPKLKVMGLEIVRSSTPEAIRNALKEAVRVALRGDEATLQEFIQEQRVRYNALPPEEIAFPRSVKGMTKYSSASNIYAKGCPMHVRGALLYNHLIAKHAVGAKYETIQEGDKIRFLYLTMPNTLGENCVGFIGRLPTEFQLTNYVDYDTMWEKSFIEPLNGIIEGLGWSARPQATLADLFT